MLLFSRVSLTSRIISLTQDVKEEVVLRACVLVRIVYSRDENTVVAHSRRCSVLTVSTTFQMHDSSEHRELSTVESVFVI